MAWAQNNGICRACTCTIMCIIRSDYVHPPWTLWTAPSLAGVDAPSETKQPTSGFCAPRESTEPQQRTRTSPGCSPAPATSPTQPRSPNKIKYSVKMVCITAACPCIARNCPSEKQGGIGARRRRCVRGKAETRSRIHKFPARYSLYRSSSGRGRRRRSNILVVNSRWPKAPPGVRAINEVSGYLLAVAGVGIYIMSRARAPVVGAREPNPGTRENCRIIAPTVGPVI